MKTTEFIERADLAVVSGAGNRVLLEMAELKRLMQEYAKAYHKKHRIEGAAITDIVHLASQRISMIRNVPTKLVMLDYTPSLINKTDIMDFAITAACDVTGLSPTEYWPNNTCRRKEFVTVRQFVVKMLRDIAKISWVPLGKMMQKDHSTLISGLTRLNDLLSYDVALQKEYMDAATKFNDLTFSHVQEQTEAA